MRTARLLVAIFAPLVVVACAVGTAPDGSEGEGTDGGTTTTTTDSGYGSTGDSGPVTAQDSGVKVDAGTKEGGATPIDSGTSPVGTAGLDCSGSTSTSGESYSDECDDLVDESDCTSGGGECGAGTCCTAKLECYLDWLGPQCVPM